jgi:RNA polymerase sigma-70 factor (ECF subfamily)
MTAKPGSNHSREQTAVSLEMKCLVDENLPVLFAYAYRLTGSVNDAEDLTQQTFLIAQQKIGQLRESAKAQRWLLRVLRNCFLKGCRKRQPVAASALDINVNQISAHAPDAADWDPEQLQKALDDLPDEFRTVVLMFYFEQLSYKEIAAHLELPMGTVMSRLSRAKNHLRHSLARTQPSPT